MINFEQRLREIDLGKPLLMVDQLLETGIELSKRLGNIKVKFEFNGQIVYVNSFTEFRSENVSRILNAVRSCSNVTIDLRG